MSAEAKIKELGIELPPPPTPAGNYVPGVQTGNLLFMSGCGPRNLDGSSISGKVGADLTTEQGYEAARLVGLNMLANIKAMLWRWAMGSPKATRSLAYSTAYS